MKLMTKAIEKQLPALYSQEKVEDPTVILKFFTPDADWTWYITEGTRQEDGDWLFFGSVVNSQCPEGELGYTTLSQLKTVKGRLGLPVERDMYWLDKPLSECISKSC